MVVGRNQRFCLTKRFVCFLLSIQFVLSIQFENRLILNTLVSLDFDKGEKERREINRFSKELIHFKYFNLYNSIVLEFNQILC